ncbi:hypothetical protein SAMN02745218_02477 [Desulfofundulus australicus DSM 11792]|jgi:hypothetical protein|uniref:Uncharacterized protein n=1 Tax=Desulfofundulus australicus DSM 11792 TaxID=1121425 RepID=A0A1M5CBS6_9FIRM|nr:hypothetical protein SAMN02745218_02477 [Desulfofundulus australicus DSM 11792]
MFQKKVRELQQALAHAKSEDSAKIFNLAVECLEVAQRERRLDELLETFPKLYEVVITFDRFFQSDDNL